MAWAWENERAPGGAGNTAGGSDPPLDLRERGLVVKATQTCSIDGCDGRTKAHGWCIKHYFRARRYGHPTGSGRATPLERFDANVHRGNDPDACWHWTGHCDDDGYGQFWVNNRNLRAHRFAYEMHVGPIPDGLVIDHLCRVRRCVNPRHLEPVTIGENILRGQDGHLQARHTNRCHRGHELTEDNFYVPTGKPNQRVCRECSRAKDRKIRARKKAA